MSDIPSISIPIVRIVIPEERQRNAAQADQALIDSIDRDGLINPILVHQSVAGDGNTIYTLVAGERRLDAHRRLKRETVRATVLEQLDPTVAFRLELAENVARKQLTWQEEAAAVTKYHALRLAAVGAMWTQMGTATDLSMSNSQVSRLLTVGAQLADEEVASCPTLQGAFNLLEGRAQRAVAAAQSRGLGVASAVTAALPPVIPLNATKAERTAIVMQNLGLEETVTATVDATDKALAVIASGAEAAMLLQADRDAERIVAANDLIINADFLEWAADYAGPKFDVLHVDFPYGKGYKGSNTRRTGKAHINPTYLDNPDIYFELVDGFASVQDNIAFPAAHMIFWFDMQYYQWTIDRITAAGWTLVQPFPLIWTKGYTGVASDVKRRPRHCYETALFFSRGDRRLVKLENDHTDCALDEKLHLNQKPLAMLRKFLSLVVDEHTAVLDPTCGSGSALAAALQLKAARVLGVELSPDNADVARYLLQRQLGEPGK